MERFWKRVTKTAGCWVISGTPDKDGYRRYWWRGQSRRAHRVSWELHTGVWPILSVLHKCDNRACVNPAHLFLGTHKDNMQDMLRKGRRSPLAGVPRKLTNADIVRARLLRSVGKHGILTQLAREYGVSATTLLRACRFRYGR